MNYVRSPYYQQEIIIRVIKQPWKAPFVLWAYGGKILRHWENADFHSDPQTIYDAVEGIKMML